ncbi:D-alanyl-D-alanine carboxypeptidase family protein [Roseibium aestuarii]|uniref:D-alanyl-D-alanine carboxypeptidase family protein n=1 Tax=Roseibium aestuarii TaxID=2600299 RepID=A0ABW4JZH7_9HYPH|nr:D-alanyl-D-alanine carboxypeptidase family protein [Roseibium aestuarii]
MRVISRPQIPFMQLSATGVAGEGRRGRKADRAKRLATWLAPAFALLLAACQSTGPAPSPTPGATPRAAAPVATVAAPAVPLLSLAPSTAAARGYSELVVDLGTGRELHAVAADEARYPASLTKMMTLYLLFDEVAQGRLTLNSPLSVSAHAAAQPPSRLGLKAGDTITVEDAARAMAVKSANDVAVVVAEAISGSEEAFARKMTATAQALGMRRTRFRNASGLPDPAHVSTARDMALLGRALKTRYAQYAPFFRARQFTWRGRSFEATNNLLGRVDGVDGLKTGYTRDAGYNLVATGRQGGARRLVVVMGGSSESARDRRVTELLQGGF